MSSSARSDIRRQLLDVIASVSGRPGRHGPQTNAAVALRDAGLAWDDLPDVLPLPSESISVWLDDDTLFGSAAVPEASVLARPSTEVLLWAVGAKPMLLFHAPEPQAAVVAAWARARGATALLSPHEFQPAHDPATTYANRAETTGPARAGSGAWRGVIAAREPARAMLGWLSLLFHWDELLGRLLGYPACCSAAFAACWREALREHGGDVAAIVTRRHGAGGFVGTYGYGTNVFARYFGFELLQHFPCRLNCVASQTLAARYAAAVDVFDAHRAARLREMLISAVLFTDRDGVALFPGSATTRDGAAATLEFDPDAVLLTKPHGRLRAQLSSGRLTATPSEISTMLGSIHGWLMDFAAGSPEGARPSHAAGESTGTQPAAVGAGPR